jgi:aliphatic sulfonates family ABC transporter substrate-binding protein
MGPCQHHILPRLARHTAKLTECYQLPHSPYGIALDDMRTDPSLARVLTMPDHAVAASGRAKAVVFVDPVSCGLQSRIERIGPSDAAVLINGETGTGKELVARELHAVSNRATKPFVAVNAGAFSEALIESELFGHERGAFTGAFAAQAGWFEAADGGTLFLDEIGELPASLQVKLLRVLQEGEVTRIGARQPRRVDVRLIAATNVDLRTAMREKRFREDLFYRLNVTSLVVPPLRARPGDILPLAHHFLNVYGRKLNARQAQLDTSAEDRLLLHTWPGNIRELENAIHNALIMRRGANITADDLQLGASEPAAPATPAPKLSASAFDDLERALIELLERGVPDLQKRVEATLLSSTYRFSGNNQLETARLLGMGRNVVRARLIEYGTLEGRVRRESAPPPRPRLQPEAIRIGYQKLGLLMLVKGYGMLDASLTARGQRVEWVEYDGGTQIVEALRSGELAAGVLGDWPAVMAQAEDVPIVYFAAEPPAPRGIALVVPERSQLSLVEQLRGKRVAVNRAAQAHYLLLRALDEVGVDPEDLEIVFTPPEQALSAFRAGEVDAWAIWDPWLSSAKLDFGARVLRDATGLFSSSVYYVARRDFAERHADVVAELQQQLQLVARWVKNDPLGAAERMAPGLGLSPRALQASLQRELGVLAVSDAQVAAQQHIADTLLRLQLIPRKVSVADAVWGPACCSSSNHQ